jgi:hypothetical protein
MSGLIITLTLFVWNKLDTKMKFNRFTPDNSPNYPETRHSDSDNIQNYGINEILSSGRFTPAERAAEYRRKGKSPSSVIDGIYNDAFPSNDEYNDMYRDWDADA